jgi:hypothetical protein
MKARISEREFNFVRIEQRSSLLERRRWLFEGSLKGEKVCAPDFPLPIYGAKTQKKGGEKG